MNNDGIKYEDYIDIDCNMLKVLQEQDEYAAAKTYIEQLQQENEKQKKILDILKPLIELKPSIINDDNLLTYKHSGVVLTRISKDDTNIVKEWLEND